MYTSVSYEFVHFQVVVDNKLRDQAVNDRELFTNIVKLHLAKVFYGLESFAKESLEFMRMVKPQKLFPTYPLNPVNRETFHPRHFCHLWYKHTEHMHVTSTVGKFNLQPFKNAKALKTHKLENWL